MEIAIIGLPKSGKTTLFNCLTGAKAPTDPFAPTRAEPNVGVAKVPDPRLDGLTAIFKPKRTVNAEVKYVDVAIPKEKGKEIGGEALVHLGKADAFIHVVRAFVDASIPHPDGSVDPARDVDSMNMELAFSDMAIIERRLARVNDSLKGAKGGERDALLHEQALLSRIGSELEKDVPVRQQALTTEETRLIQSYQFLTMKPMLQVLNIGEDQIGEGPRLEAELKSSYPEATAAALCAKLEAELSELGQDEAAEFRSAMGAGEPATERILRLSQQLLGLVTFFTIASGEVKAWTVATGTPAAKAAGKIHSDMERGFIRAEVISYPDLQRSGSLADARKHGLLRLEGKDYIVQDGDVITFLFNV
ncbi:MAG: redox-regulated ATPase YchF [Chloroflexi bacterium]|nr:MAG: redox-regulated ATPase YchF [Chloroflexota bacterium]RLC95102.1 MAG: redox-regulated ATPase YchF [Chloroflexota bacterium]